MAIKTQQKIKLKLKNIADKRDKPGRLCKLSGKQNRKREAVTQWWKKIGNLKE